MDAQMKKSTVDNNVFLSKDMIYTTAAIQKQIMNGLNNGGTVQSSLYGQQAPEMPYSAVHSRPTRTRLDPRTIAKDEHKMNKKKQEMSAAQNIEANKFDNNNLINLTQDVNGRADAFLFKEEPNDGAGLVGRPGSGANTKKRAQSPELGGGTIPFTDMQRPKTVKMRSGKSVEPRGFAGGGIGGGDQTVPKNFAYKQRIKHFADPVDYPQQNYEKRIKDLAKNNITRTQLNPKVVETWLNETLTDAGHLEIPGVILQPESKKPLERYKIGINQLKDNNISLEQTNRIYRALFVYSLGFYEMLQKEISHSKNKNQIQNSIWKVYTILLEYCCKTNYEMQIRGILKEHKKEMERQEDIFNEYQERMTNNENRLKEDLGVAHVDNEKLTREIAELKFQNDKLKKDMLFERKTHEEEVQLRLQFESKLNSLHALHRDVKNLYSRAIEDILGLKTQNDEQDKVIKEYQEELIQLRSTKESNHQEIATLKESLAYSENEINIKTIAIKKLQDEILQKDRENDKLQQDVNNQEQIYYGLQMEISKHKSDKQTLEQDQERLNIELDLTKQMRDQFCDQLEDVSAKYKELLQNYNTIQKDYVAIDELKRDRDNRINMLRGELTELSEKHDQLLKDDAALKIRHDTCLQELEDLKREDEKLVVQLEQANVVRREQEEQFYRLKEDSKMMTVKFEESKNEITQLKKKADKLQQRLDMAERDYAELNVRYDSEQKQSEIQRQQLNDKLKNLDQLLCNEKDTRETWMGKCQMEQEQHTKTNVELLRIRSLHQNAEMEHKNALINFETVKEARSVLAAEHEALLKEASQLRAKNENLEREVYAKMKLLESVEAQQKAMIRQLREDNKKVIEEYEAKVLKQMMLYEDLRSFSVHKHKYAEKLLQDIEDLKEKLRVQKEENNKLDNQIEKLEKEIETEQDQYQELKRDTNELRLSNSLKAKENEQLQQLISDQSLRISEFIQEQKKAEEQIAQIPVLEGQKKELEKKLKQAQDLLQKQLTQTEGVERGYGPNNVIYVDDEAQTDAEQTGFDPAAMDQQLEGMVDYSSQQNSYQNIQTNQLQQQQQQQSTQMQMMSQPAGGDNQSMALMMNHQRMGGTQGLGSQSHQGIGMGAVTPKTHQMNQMMLNQASHLNISHTNTRQAISLGKQGLGRIQSAVNTAQSTAIGTRHGGLAQQMNMVSQGYRTGLSSQGAIGHKDLDVHSKSKTQIHRTISGEGDSRSTDRKNNFMQASLPNAEVGRTNLAAAMGAQAGLDLSIDEQVQRYAPNSNNRPTTGVPTGYRNNFATGETPLVQGQLAPHALYNHHAYSKKSFRIRGQAEQEYMKMQSSSNKDMAIIDFNNDILKSVYELRKSHAALAGRPTTQQLITKGRRDIQSAAARQKEMAFGGFMIPTQMDLESAENFFNQFPMVDPNKILEMNEQISQDGTLQVKEKKAKSMRTSIPNNAPIPRHPGPISQIQIQQKPALSTLKQKKSATVGMKSPLPDQNDKAVNDGMRSTSNISGTQGPVNQQQHAIPVKGVRNANESMSVSGASVNVMTNAFTGANPHQLPAQPSSNVTQGQANNLLAPATQQLLQNRNNSVLTSGGGSHAEGLRLAESLSTFNMNAVITTKSAGNINQRAKASSSQGGAGRNIKNIIKMASSRDGLRE